MSVECVDFISVAERLLAVEESEIAWRVAAGRAYYGAFHCCRDLVNKQPSIAVNNTLGDHERIYQAISALGMAFPGAKDLKKLAYIAMQLRDVRGSADYDIADSFRKEQALQAIVTARKVHDSYRQFRANYKL